MNSRILLGGLLLLVGGGLFASTLISFGSNVPKDATWIFVPHQSNLPDYNLGGVTLRLDLTNSSHPMLQLEFDLCVFNNKTSYGLGILQPLHVIQNGVTTLNSMGTASDPITSVTQSGSYFTRTQYKFRSPGCNFVFLNVPVSEAITSWMLGRRGTGFTFGSGLGIPADPEIEQFETATSPSEILNRGLTLSTFYPPDWQLSLSETFPLPDKQFGVGQDRAATWFLNFSKTLPLYFVTVSLVWNAGTLELWARNWANFLSGIMIGIGSGILAESARRNKERSRKRSATR